MLFQGITIVICFSVQNGTLRKYIEHWIGLSKTLVHKY
jgi:hypothetical protein